MSSHFSVLNACPAHISVCLKLMWWIFLHERDGKDALPQDEKRNLDRGEASTLELPPINPAFQPIGHIALDYLDYRGDLSLANRETGTMYFSRSLALQTSLTVFSISSGPSPPSLYSSASMARDLAGKPWMQRSEWPKSTAARCLL